MFSQNNTTQEHLTFVGIPIDGELSDFIKKMKRKNFILPEDPEEEKFPIYDYDFSRAITMEGKFTREYVHVHIYFTSKSNTVKKVLVFLPIKEDWTSLEDNYKYYKKLISNKYGKQADSKETFGDEQIENNHSKLKAVEDGKCNFWTKWKLSSGWIKTQICGNRVTIEYVDNINTKLGEKEDEEDV